MSQTQGASADEQGAEQPDDGPMSVPDEKLPDDVRPSEDNPLAEPAGDDVPDDILKETSERRPLEDADEGSDEGSEDDAGGDAEGPGED
jgi:hypothetical protein